MYFALPIVATFAALASSAKLPRELSTDTSCGNKGAGHGKGLTCNPKVPESGRCCSEYGWCGNGNSFCGQGCQPQECGGKIPTVCGPKHGSKICGFGDCCNQEGFCGTGLEFCTVPEICDRNGFGRCDSDVTPKGPSTHDDKRNLQSMVAYGEPIYQCKKPRTIALTFDDGPNKYTTELLDILKAYGGKATFMVAGITNGRGQLDKSEERQRLVQRMLAEGHQIASHTWSHPNLSNMPSDARKLDMHKNERAIANIIGKYPTYMRAPYGDCTTESGCVKDLKDLGYHQIQESLDTLDWKYPHDMEKAEKHIENFFSKVGPNDNALVCQHDTIGGSVKHLTPIILQHAIALGWKAVTVGECLNDPMPNWYNEPKWLAPGLAPEGACAISREGFCGTIPHFTNKEECWESNKACYIQYKDCMKLPMGHADMGHAGCEQLFEYCEMESLFCASCDTKHGRPCKDKNFRWKKD